MRYAKAAQILRLKPQITATHFRGIERYERARDIGQQHGLQSAQVPFGRRDEIQVMVRVKLARLINDMRFPLNVGDEQLRHGSQFGVNPIDCAIPSVRIFLRDVARLDRGTVTLKIGGELWIVLERYKFAIRSERIDDTEAAPLHRALKNVERHDQRQLAVRLDIKIFEIADKDLIRTRGDANADLAPRFLDGRILGFDAAHEA